MFKIVAFDMDETIADTIPMCIQAFQNSISPYVDHELGEKEIMKTFGLNEIGMVKSVVTQDWESAIKDFYDQYEQLHDKVTEMFPDMLRLLMFLKKQKIVVALITGKGEKCCAITLRKYQTYLMKYYAVQKELRIKRKIWNIFCANILYLKMNFVT